MAVKVHIGQELLIGAIRACTEGDVKVRVLSIGESRDIPCRGCHFEKSGNGPVKMAESLDEVLTVAAAA